MSLFNARRQIIKLPRFYSRTYSGFNEESKENKTKIRQGFYELKVEIVAP